MALFPLVIGNKALSDFLCAFLAYGFAAGMWYGLVFLYVDSYLGLGEHFATDVLAVLYCGHCRYAWLGAS